MSPDTWEKVSEIFHTAVELHPDERQNYLIKACGSDEVLRREVESLLAAVSEAGSFISEPAVDFAHLSKHIPEPQTLSGSDLGHYRIEKSIGKGGMGEVYLATDTRLNRRVAIKKLPDVFAGDAGFVKRFQNEAQAAATLNHPNVATIYSVEDFDGRPLITMEYVEGKTLESLTPEDGIDLEDFFEWFVPIADAIRHAHEKGVVHRDVKPGNIMISSDGTPKILDFGLAQVATGTLTPASNITQPGQIIGTPSYMSPEQAEGKDVDARSDIFSFGVVMYEAITGTRPFKGDSHAEVVSNVLKHDPPSVGRVRSGIPTGVARLIAGCLKKRQRDRFRDMSEVKSILERERGSYNSGTSTGSFLNRFYRESQPRSLAWLLAAAILTLSIAFSGWLYFSWTDTRPPISFENMTMRLMSQSDNIAYAEILPDGNSIAYVTIEENDDRALWIRRIDDRNALQLVPPQPVQYWVSLTPSPDGSRIYYITAQRDARSGTLYRVSTLGGPSRKLVDEVNRIGSLSPDGSRILFVRYGSSNRAQLISADSSDGSGESVIMTADENVLYHEPRYSADGTKIIYIKFARSDGEENWSIVEIPAGGGAEKEVIARQKPRIGGIAVLNDGGLLMNAIDPVSLLPQLYYVHRDGRTPTRITNDLNSYFGVSVDRAGKRIVATERHTESYVWAGDAADPAGMKKITTEPNGNERVSWTMDGRIVFDAVDNNRPHIWIIDPNGGTPVQLTSNNSSDSSPQVTVDGRHIVFVSDRSGVNKIWRINIDGSDPVMLAPAEGTGFNPVLSPDGQYVYFTWDRNKERLLGRVPLAGGQVDELPSFRESRWALSPDASMVAFTFWDDTARQRRVGISPLNDPSNPTILNISPTRLLKWTGDGGGLLYSESDVGANPYATVKMMDIKTRKVTEYLSAAPDWVMDISISPDGKKIAALRGRIITNAVMLSKVSAK